MISNTMIDEFEIYFLRFDDLMFYLTGSYAGYKAYYLKKVYNGWVPKKLEALRFQKILKTKNYNKKNYK